VNWRDFWGTRRPTSIYYGFDELDGVLHSHTADVDDVDCLPPKHSTADVAMIAAQHGADVIMTWPLPWGCGAMFGFPDDPNVFFFIDDFEFGKSAAARGTVMRGVVFAERMRMFYGVESAVDYALRFGLSRPTEEMVRTALDGQMRFFATKRIAKLWGAIVTELDGLLLDSALRDLQQEFGVTPTTALDATTTLRIIYEHEITATQQDTGLSGELPDGAEGRSEREDVQGTGGDRGVGGHQ
jgi:hypothetical protein